MLGEDKINFTKNEEDEFTWRNITLEKVTNLMKNDSYEGCLNLFRELQRLYIKDKSSEIAKEYRKKLSLFNKRFLESKLEIEDLEIWYANLLFMLIISQNMGEIRDRFDKIFQESELKEFLLSPCVLDSYEKTALLYEKNIQEVKKIIKQVNEIMWDINIREFF